MKNRSFWIYGMALFLGACSAEEAVDATVPEKTVEETQAEAAPQIQLGNGTHNYIILEGVARNEATFTFKKVAIDKPGWLVIHPFKDGVPVQAAYVGVVPLSIGEHTDVSIEIGQVPATGDMFIVMLHYDVNEDSIFDFNDGITVPDVPVFEGNTLVALRFVAP